jgi:predicted RNA binding protein YcfA (HicA-like mRNA interferase family)
VERDSKRIVELLLREGWVHVSTRGSHHKFRKDGRTVIVPHPRRDLPVGTARRIARDAGWL